MFFQQISMSSNSNLNKLTMLKKHMLSLRFGVIADVLNHFSKNNRLFSFWVFNRFE